MLSNASIPMLGKAWVRTRLGMVVGENVVKGNDSQICDDMTIIL